MENEKVDINAYASTDILPIGRVVVITCHDKEMFQRISFEPNKIRSEFHAFIEGLNPEIEKKVLSKRYILDMSFEMDINEKMKITINDYLQNLKMEITDYATTALRIFSWQAWKDKNPEMALRNQIHLEPLHGSIEYSLFKMSGDPIFQKGINDISTKSVFYELKSVMRTALRMREHFSITEEEILKSLI